MAIRGSLMSETMEIDLPSAPAASAEKQKKARGFLCPSATTCCRTWHRLRHAHFTVSNNYHSEGRPRDMERRRVYAIAIRKDKPFVLDFSNKPDVMFASPAKSDRFKPGDEVSVKAVLVDPGLDIMIRGLSDARRTKKETYRLNDGKTQSYDRPLSLDPVVTVADSSGKKVAEGTMPFG